MKVTKEELINRAIWIWGARNNGAGAMNLIINNGGIVKGFIDNATELQGKYVLGTYVYRPEDVYNQILETDMVICCCNNHNNQSIISQLREQGIVDNVREFDWEAWRGTQETFGSFWEGGYEAEVVSKCCRQLDFEQDYFKRIERELCRENAPILHRKTWEFVYIINTLEHFGMLKSGKRGLGFVVGEEPLPSYFASKHIHTVATDLGIGTAAAKVWVESNQNVAGDKEKLYFGRICDRDDFERYVTYRDVDMNHIPDDIGTYDFCWSSCAIEHVGGLELSKRFLKNMLNVLKPGGIAVHTTEFNLWSNDDTLTEGYSVIYRKKDLEEIADWCKENGHFMPLSFKRGDVCEGDMYLDTPPYEYGVHKYHICLMVGPYASTSYGIIIRKAE